MWLLFAFSTVLGSLIGYWASQSRGFSPAVGIIGGTLLGIFAPVLFLLGRPAGTRICPHCAERVKAAAKVCRHCGREVPVVAVGTAKVRDTGLRYFAYVAAIPVGVALILGAIIWFSFR